MKKNIYDQYLRLCFLALLSVAACNPEDNDHLKIPQLESGGAVWAKVDPDNSFFDVSSLSTSKFVLDLEAFDFKGGTLIDRYDIYVSFVDASEGKATDTLFLKTVSEFPTRIEITPMELATVFELPNGLDDLGAGDFFNFTMEVVMKDGKVFNLDNTSDDIALENNSRGTFLLSTFIGCPTFNRDELIGMYNIVKDEFEVALVTSTEVVAGPAANEIIIKDVFGHGLDMTVTLDNQGIASVEPRQHTWEPQNFGLPPSYGKGYAQGSGRAFSCIGTITLDFTYSVDIGTFAGSYNYTISKQ